MGKIDQHPLPLGEHFVLQWTVRHLHNWVDLERKDHKPLMGSKLRMEAAYNVYSKKYPLFEFRIVKRGRAYD